MLSCHLCLLISCYSLVFCLLRFDCYFCLIAWYLYFLLFCYFFFIQVVPVQNLKDNVVPWNLIKEFEKLMVSVGQLTVTVLGTVRKQTGFCIAKRYFLTNYSGIGDLIGKVISVKY